MKRRFSFLIYPLLLGMLQPAHSGVFTKDVPREIVTNPGTEHLVLSVNKPVVDVLKKIRLVNVKCGGDRLEEATDDTSTLLVAWESRDTVSYILKIEDDAGSTHVTAFMNSNVARQRRGWPLVFDDWFVKGTDRCVPEILRSS